MKVKALLPLVSVNPLLVMLYKTSIRISAHILQLQLFSSELLTVLFFSERRLSFQKFLALAGSNKPVFFSLLCVKHYGN